MYCSKFTMNNFMILDKDSIFLYRNNVIPREFISIHEFLNNLIKRLFKISRELFIFPHKFTHSNFSLRFSHTSKLLNYFLWLKIIITHQTCICRLNIPLNDFIIINEWIISVCLLQEFSPQSSSSKSSSRQRNSYFFSALRTTLLISFSCFFLRDSSRTFLPDSLIVFSVNTNWKSTPESS